VGIGVGATTLVAGGTIAEAAEATIATATPYYDAGKELLAGDKEAAQKSATIETVANISSFAAAIPCAKTAFAMAAVGGPFVAGAAATVAGLACGMGAGMFAAKTTEQILESKNQEPEKPQNKYDKYAASMEKFDQEQHAGRQVTPADFERMKREIKVVGLLIPNQDPDPQNPHHSHAHPLYPQQRRSEHQVSLSP
jgi:hypothetical protein